MDTNTLKKFAQAARNLLIDQVCSKLDLVIYPASPARREHPQAMRELDAAIVRDGKAQVIEQVAYTWFNRFTALRFMDANGYTTVGVVSPAGGQTRPEILAEAMAGNLPEGAPGSFSLPAPLIDAFAQFPSVSSLCNAKKGTTTGNNERYLRFHWECDRETIGFTGKEEGKRFFPHAKGGDARKWFGNLEYLLGYDGSFISQMEQEKGFRHDGKDFFFKEGLSWSGISSDVTAFRYSPDGLTFNNAAPTAFFEQREAMFEVLLAVNSKVARPIIQTLNPTLNFNPGDFGNIPIAPPEELGADIVALGSKLVDIARSDWDAYETSWDFTTLPLLQSDHRAETLEDSYTTLRTHWQGMTDEMQRLEEENNRIFIDAYGLQDELTSEVPIEEITLTCNPAYRYGIKNDVEANETRLRADTMAEFLSYAVGGMFGRYSLDAPGLILANQGERLEDYLARIPEPTFTPDADNVIPVLDENWFADDITERFRLFLRVTFGETHFQENLRYIEDALGKDIRKYFTKDFYADHVKRYKKRPIYWMFSSPKGTFNALIYMHRYRGDTVSVLLNDYLREFISKLEGERGRLEKLSDDPSASQGQRTKALKDMAVIAKQIDELNEWERDVVFPLAQAKIEIDLDDGVKANYPKFGAALKKIPGLEASDD